MRTNSFQIGPVISRPLSTVASAAPPGCFPGLAKPCLPWLTAVLFLILGTVSAAAQAPLISSFGRNGELVCSNIEPGRVAIVEWASSVSGPWTNSWAGLDAVTADAQGVIHVHVPMFYRVRAIPRMPNPDPARMVWIDPGTFTMGSPATEATRTSWEGPQTTVTLSQGFWLGKYEVTQGEYLEVTGANPSHFTGGPNLPVEQVTWFDAVAYCAALTAREEAAGRLSSEYAYRLPTAAEWEYACRAGTTTAFSYGSALLSGMANFDGTTEYPPCGDDPNSCANPDGINIPHTTTVGSYPPNAWGLYDMHGNVWEWCQDWYFASLPGGHVTDPQGPASGTSRVMRGGRWGYAALFSRSAGRGYLRPDQPNTNGGDGLDLGGNGFRVVLSKR